MASIPQHLRRILETSPLLADLVRQAQNQTSHTQAVRDLLPADLAPHLLAAVGEQERLVLLTDSSVWASRLRFATNALRRGFPEMRNVRVRVVPPAIPPRSAIRSGHRQRPLDRSAAEQMNALAHTVDDPGLSRALLRLASHGAPDSEY